MSKAKQKTLNGVIEVRNAPVTINDEKIRSGRTRTKESSTRKKVDSWLINLGWNIDAESQNCNVTTERAITVEQSHRPPNEIRRASCGCSKAQDFSF